LAAKSNIYPLLSVVAHMAKSTHIPQPYGDALVLSLVFQVLAWLACFIAAPTFRFAGSSDEFLLNWRSWIISCSVFWFGFLVVFLTQREQPSRWRLLYVRYGFLFLFFVAAFTVPRIYGAD
jgi:hypothetical protein